MEKVFLLLTALTVLSCKSDDEAPDPGNYQTPLPEATQNGKGTFGITTKNGTNFIRPLYY